MEMVTIATRFFEFFIYFIFEDAAAILTDEGRLKVELIEEN